MKAFGYVFFYANIATMVLLTLSFIARPDVILLVAILLCSFSTAAIKFVLNEIEGLGDRW